MEINLSEIKKNQGKRSEHQRSEHSPGQRSHPSIWQYDYLVLKALADDVTDLLKRARAEIVENSPLALDIGCDKSPYKVMLENMGFEVQSMDIDLSKGADLAGSVESTGLRNQQIDLIICTQVLEHCSEPWTAASELYRILKPHGILLVTVPHTWFYHPHPDDNWRFTPEGICRLLDGAGFESLSLRSQGGSFLCFFQILNFLLFGVVGTYGAPIYACNNFIGSHFDKIISNPLFPINVAALAKKW